MTRVCIIGAGMSGTILASELLLSKNIHVDLVDIDSLKNGFDVKNELKKKVDDGLILKSTVGYGFGGTSNLWHGVMGLLDQEDWDYIEGRAAQKLCRDDVDSNLDELTKYFGDGVEDLAFKEENLEFQLSEFIDTSRLASKKYKVQMFPTRMRSLVKRFSRKEKSLLTLHENATALLLNADDSGYISSVNLAKNGKKIELFADYFIVCAGGLESPRLLKQSFEGAVHDNPLIGLGLMDHPHALIGELVVKRKIFYRQHAINSFVTRISTRIGFTLPLAERTIKHLNHSLMIRPSFGKDERDSREAIKTILYGRNIFRLLLAACCDRTVFRALLVLLFEKIGVGVYTDTFLVSLQLEQTQDEGSVVRLTNSFDELGRAIPEVIRMFGDDLVEGIANVTLLVQDLCYEGTTFTKFDIDKTSFVSGSHHSGTCRLGSEKNDSVVNSDLLFHGIKNLYVCDASIFPKIGNANLSVTIGLFAVRLAKYIKRNTSNEYPVNL